MSQKTKYILIYTALSLVIVLPVLLLIILMLVFYFVRPVHRLMYELFLTCLDWHESEAYNYVQETSPAVEREMPEL